MTAEQFAYWLQGFAELSGATPPTVEQWQSIREHLGTVFDKVTPEVKPKNTLTINPGNNWSTAQCVLAGASNPFINQSLQNNYDDWQRGQLTGQRMAASGSFGNTC